MLTRPFQTPYLPDYVSPASVQHRVSDFTPDSLVETFHGTDLLISTVPGYDVQDVILQSAVVARVPRFIPYEFGHDALNAAIQRRLPGVSERATMIERLRKQSNQHPDKLQWVGIAMGCILDTALSNGNLGFDLTWQSGTMLGTGHEIFAATSLERVGIVVECVIRNWGVLKNQYIYAAGTLTCHDRRTDGSGLAEGSPGERAEKACGVHDGLCKRYSSARCCGCGGPIAAGELLCGESAY